MGDSGTFYHKNDSGMTVYFVWGAANTDGGQLAGLSHDMETTTLTMPRITGITGLEPGEGDLIADSSSRYWGVVSIRKLGLPSNPCAWQLEVMREAELNRTDG